MIRWIFLRGRSIVLEHAKEALGRLDTRLAVYNGRLATDTTLYKLLLVGRWSLSWGRLSSLLLFGFGGRVKGH